MEMAARLGDMGSLAHAAEDPGEDQLMWWFQCFQRSSTAWCRMGELGFGAVEQKGKLKNISKRLGYDGQRVILPKTYKILMTKMS